MGRDALLQTARVYVHGYGYSVVSIGPKKKPNVRKWKPFQTRQPTDEELCQMFRRENSVGVAIVSGFADVAGRDFDAEGSYTAWTQDQPELAARMPTVLSPGGKDRAHVHFRWPGTRSRTFDDGELKGEGSLLIMPPSLHPNGGIYEWLREPGDDGFPFYDPAKIGLSAETRRTTKTDGLNGNDGNDGNDGITGVSLSVVKPANLVRPYLPTARGQNDQLTFTLARRLRALELEIGRELTFEEFNAFFDCWWEANPHRPPEGREYAFDKLQRAFNTVLSPLGTTHEELAAKQAKKRPLPRVAFRYDKERTRQSVAILREMQVIAGEGKAWKLACWQLARQLNCHDAEAWRELDRLRSKPDPIIRRVTRGIPKPGGSGRTSTWLYLKPLDDEGEQR